MNPAHIHLVLNHIPILGTMIFAPLVLIWGLLRHSRDITQTGLLLAIILAVTTIPIYLTGEPAEEHVEKQPWFSKTLGAAAALVGGEIRHNEIRSGTVPPAAQER